MIAFRKAHPSLCRSRYWRDDVKWYGTDQDVVDMSDDSRAFAFYLDGESKNDDDFYGMINAGDDDLKFSIQNGLAEDWKRVVSTSQKNKPEKQARKARTIFAKLDVR